MQFSRSVEGQDMSEKRFNWFLYIYAWSLVVEIWSVHDHFFKMVVNPLKLIFVLDYLINDFNPIACMSFETSKMVIAHSPI